MFEKSGKTSGKRRSRQLMVEALESRNLPSQLTWNPSANLTTPRGGVVAEPQGGGIAVFGGGLTDVPAVSVTNPSGEATVSTLAPLANAITGPGAGLLANGSVLVFGGVSGGSASAVATKYDYTGANTHPVSSMRTPRAQLGFATDGSNNIYAIGGVNASGTPLKSAESYNAGSGDWTSAGNLPQTLYAEAAVYDGAGHIVTFGGVGADGNITSNVYEYTIASGTWTTVATTMPVAVRDSAAVLASNGRIYFLGGKTASGATADVESYDPVGNTWTTEAPLPTPLSNEAVVSDGFGRIEILGGYDASGAATANVWVSQQLNQPDAAPVITSTPSTTYLYAGYTFSYQVVTTANPQASYQLTSAPPGMSINAATGLITWTPTASQTGTFSFTVEAMNAIGMNSQTVSLNVSVARPTYPTNLTQTGETVSTATLSWTASYDPLYGIDHYVINSYVPHGHSGRGGGITYIITPVATTTTTTGTVTGLYSNFSGWFVVNAVNTKGVSSGYSYVYTLHTLPDTVPPTITVPADVTVTTSTPSGTQVPSAFTATGSDPGPGLDKITVDYFVNGGVINNTYLFPLGPTTVTVTAYDLYGQYASGTFKVTVLNAVGPTLLLPPNQVAVATNPGGAQVPAAFTASAPDFSATDTLTYLVGSTPINSSYDFPVGVTTVSVTASDTTGSMVSGTFTVTVTDTTPPTLTVPANLTVEATSSMGALAPGAFTATATDPVTVNPTITYYVGSTIITSSYVFRFGTTYVAVVASNTAGNTTSKAFTVTVVDTTPPALTLPPDQTVAPTSAAGAQDPAAFTATATDAGSQFPPIITYSAFPIAISPGYTFPLGVTTVLVQATDSWGNSSNGTFTVTVPPGPGLTLLVPSNQTVQAASAAGIQDAGAFTASTYDLSGTPTVTYSVGSTPISSSMVFPVGTTTVTVTASDSAGNSKSGSFTVTVQSPPVIAPTPVSWTPGVSLLVGLADATAFVPSSNDFASGIWLFGGATSAGAASSVYFLAPGFTSWEAALALNQGYISPAVGETHNVGPLATDGDTVYKYSDDLFLYGGNNGTHASSSLVNYTNNPPIGTGQGSTVAGPSMSTARGALAYAADPLTGDLYAIGGLNATRAALASAEVYNPITDAWSAIAPLPQAIYAAVGLADGAGHLFVFGGDNSAGAPVATAYRYTISTNTWDTVASLPVATSNAAGVRGPDGNIYLLGGKTGSGVVANVLVYNPNANIWSTSTPLPAPVYGATAAVDSNENIEVIGGYNSAGQPQSTVLVSQNVPVPPPHLVISTPVPASISVSQYLTLNVAVEDAGGNVLTGNSDLLGVTVDGPDGVTQLSTSTLQLYNGTGLYDFLPSQVSNTPGMYTVSFSDGTVKGASVTFGLAAIQAIPSVSVTGGSFPFDETGHAATATALGTGGTPVNGSFTYTYNASSALPTDVGTYAVVASFTSSDPNYSGTVATGTLTITPTSPLLALGGTGTAAFDGTTHAVTATALGVDGITPVSGSFTIYYNGSTTAPSAPGTYAVQAIFNSSNPDYNGLSATDTLTITPARLVLSAPATVVPGTPFDLTVSAQDSSGHTVTGFGGVVTLASSSGADITPSTLLVLYGSTTVPVTLSAAGNQTVTVSYPGLASASATILVTGGPASPFQVSLPGSTTVQAGSGFLVAIQAVDASGNPVTSYSGPSTVTVTVSPASAASNLPATVPIGSNGLGLFLAHLPQAGTYTFSVISGATIAGAGPVTVVPGPAARLGFSVQPVDTPTGVTLPPLTVQVFDQYGNVATSDSSDVVTLIANGPGGFTAGSTASAVVSSGLATFNNLTLATPGSYTLSALVPGQYTGPASAAFHVLPLQVVSGSFASTPSGFSLQFNAPFLVNSMTPALFGTGFGASGAVPSVTLTQTSDAAGNAVDDPVEGSLLLSPATNSVTFLATNTAYEANTGQPILPDGTYTVEIASSGPTGFQGLSGGGYLDGVGTGTPGSGDFTASFNVTTGASGADVVWAPDTADGPGQALNAPGKNQVGGGYPIYLSDTTGAVTDVQVTFNYDPTLLNVTGVSGTGVTLLASTPGQVVFQYSGAVLATGSQTPIGSIDAAVPAGTSANPTPYRAKDLLHLSNVLLNGGTISVATSDGLHLVAYVGDADGNGGYSSNDAVLITRVALQTDTGFTAYPLVDSVIVADTDGSGFLPADAALQINEAGVGYPTANLTIPPIPPGVHLTSSGSGGAGATPARASRVVNGATQPDTPSSTVFQISTAPASSVSASAGNPGQHAADTVFQTLIGGRRGIELTENTPEIADLVLARALFQRHGMWDNLDLWNEYRLSNGLDY